MRYPEGREKALTFSYDDAPVQDEKLVKLFLESGVKGTFNLSPDFFGKTCVDPPHQSWMDLESVKRTYTGTGMEVALHGYTHGELPMMDDAAMLWEILLNRKVLEDLFDCRVSGFAYPQGAVDARTERRLADAGVDYARIATAGSESFQAIPDNWYRWEGTAHHGHPRLMELAEQFMTARATTFPWYHTSEPMLFYVWGHSYEFWASDNWWIMEKFLDRISGHPGEIWYATNLEIFRYTKAFQSLQYSVERGIVYNPSGCAVWLLKDEKTYCVEPGKELILQ
ncbi:MAG: polysaccharide deacetylase family protein [Oscillospiraceae bacterium]|nr:polysaccharide deacetylase family protein [Oscillospiraceae bacterium]